MSHAQLLKVWNYSDAKGSTLLVLMALADLADEDGTVEVSGVELAGRARLTPRYVVESLKQLVDDGRIKRLEVGGGSKLPKFQITEVLGEAEKEVVRTRNAEAKQLFEYWRDKMGKKASTLFDNKRKTRALWAVKSYGLEQCKQAVDWYAEDEWHVEHSQNDLALIFRDAQHAERFLEGKPKPKPVPASHVPFEDKPIEKGVPMPDDVKNQLRKLGLYKGKPPASASAGG